MEHVEKTAENDIKGLETKKAYRYMGMEENHNTEHKREEERLKNEYVRRL
jgi:hypothetical protein